MIVLPVPEEWFNITGRGLVASYPKGSYDDPGDLLNQEVDIDGTTYKVTGVEMFMVNIHPYTLPFGLLVKEIS